MRAVGNSLSISLAYMPPLPYYAVHTASANQMACMAAVRAHLLFGIITTILQFASSYDKYFQCRNPIIRFCAWLRAAFTYFNAYAQSIQFINTTTARQPECWRAFTHPDFGPFACVLFVVCDPIFFNGLFSFSVTQADNKK